MRSLFTALVAVVVLWTPLAARRAVFDFVQVKTGASFGASTAVVFDGSVVAGNSVVVGAVYYSSDTSHECHDASGAYANIANDNANMKVYYKANLGGGSTTVTCTATGALGIFVQALEYTGNLLFDQKSFGTSTGTSVSSGSTSTTSTANELLVGFECHGTGGFLSEDAAFTNRVNDVADGTFCVNSSADDTVSSTGTYSFTGTLSVSQAWLSEIVTFSEVAGVVGVVPAIINNPIRGGLRRSH